MKQKIAQLRELATTEVEIILDLLNQSEDSGVINVDKTPTKNLFASLVRSGYTPRGSIVAMFLAGYLNSAQYHQARAELGLTEVTTKHK